MAGRKKRSYEYSGIFIEVPSDLHSQIVAAAKANGLTKTDFFITASQAMLDRLAEQKISA